MTTPDLHPEELIDKAMRDGDALLAQEREQLFRHLAGCRVCRFELEARASFRSVPLESDDLERFFGDGAAKQRMQRPRLRRAGLGAYLAAASVLVTTAVALGAAARWSALWHRPSVSSPSTDRQSVARPAVEPNQAAADSAPPTTSPPVPVVATPLAQSLGRPTPHASISPKVSWNAPRANGLFEAATHARIRGDRVQAIQLYRSLLDRFPAATEAPLAQAELGRLLLDMGEAGQAVGPLEAYLRSGDPAVREEVLVASAMALARLNRNHDEAKRWAQLIHDYPQSIHVQHARDRLREVGAH